jgi:hypothetical protein
MRECASAPPTDIRCEVVFLNTSYGVCISFIDAVSGQKIDACLLESLCGGNGLGLYGHKNPHGADKCWTVVRGVQCLTNDFSSDHKVLHDSAKTCSGSQCHSSWSCSTVSSMHRD